MQPDPYATDPNLTGAPGPSPVAPAGTVAVDTAGPARSTGRRTQRRRKNDIPWQNFLYVGVAVVVLILSFFLIHARKKQEGGEAKERILKHYANYPDQALVKKLVNKYHSKCENACFDAGNRYRASSFDHTKYRNMMRERIDRELGYDMQPPP
jgi:hypothetical protein